MVQLSLKCIPTINPIVKVTSNTVVMAQIILPQVGGLGWVGGWILQQKANLSTA